MKINKYVDLLFNPSSQNCPVSHRFTSADLLLFIQVLNFQQFRFPGCSFLFQLLETNSLTPYSSPRIRLGWRNHPSPDWTQQIAPFQILSFLKPFFPREHYLWNYWASFRTFLRCNAVHSSGMLSHRVWTVPTGTNTTCFLHKKNPPRWVSPFGYTALISTWKFTPTSSLVQKSYIQIKATHYLYI